MGPSVLFVRCYKREGLLRKVAERDRKYQQILLKPRIRYNRGRYNQGPIL